jgi:hypothetical protein
MGWAGTAGSTARPRKSPGVSICEPGVAQADKVLSSGTYT